MRGWNWDTFLQDDDDADTSGWWSPSLLSFFRPTWRARRDDNCLSASTSRPSMAGIIYNCFGSNNEMTECRAVILDNFRQISSPVSWVTARWRMDGLAIRIIIGDHQLHSWYLQQRMSTHHVSVSTSLQMSHDLWCLWNLLAWSVCICI